jgi:hypothetical protein
LDLLFFGFASNPFCVLHTWINCTTHTQTVRRQPKERAKERAKAKAKAKGKAKPAKAKAKACTIVSTDLFDL